MYCICSYEMGSYSQRQDHPHIPWQHCRCSYLRLLLSVIRQPRSDSCLLFFGYYRSFRDFRCIQCFWDLLKYVAEKSEIWFSVCSYLQMHNTHTHIIRMAKYKRNLFIEGTSHLFLDDVVSWLIAMYWLDTLFGVVILKTHFPHSPPKSVARVEFSSTSSPQTFQWLKHCNSTRCKFVVCAQQLSNEGHTSRFTFYNDERIVICFGPESFFFFYF